MKRFFLVMFGLALIAVCASWFVGLFDDLVRSTLELQSPDSARGEGGTRSLRSDRKMVGGLDINTILNAANAVIGFVGLLVTYRASRGNKSDTSSA